MSLQNFEISFLSIPEWFYLQGNIESALDKVGAEKKRTILYCLGSVYNCSKTFF